MRRPTIENPPIQYATFPKASFIRWLRLKTISASSPAPAIRRKCRRDSCSSPPAWLEIIPSATRSLTDSARASAARSMVFPIPSSLASTLAVPAGRMPKGTSEWTIPLTASLMVPSPPATRIRSAPRSTAQRAISPACPGPVVAIESTVIPCASSNSMDRRSAWLRRLSPPA